MYRNPLPDDAESWFELGATVPSPLPKKAAPPKPAAESDDGDDDDIGVIAETSDVQTGDGTTAGAKKRTADEADLDVVAENGSASKKGKVVSTADDEDDVIIVDA